MKEMWFVYAICVIARLRGLKMVLDAPQFHGRDCCLDFRVGPDFYNGDGEQMIREYRTRTIAPYVVEFIVAVVLIAMGKLLWTFFAMLPFGLFGVWNNSAALRRLARQAKPFALGAPEPVPVAVSLTPRSVVQYSNRRVEAALGTATLLSALLLGYSILNHLAPLAEILSLPILCIYAQAGLLLAKRSVVDWRVSRIPASRTPEFLAWQDEGRRLMAAMVDWVRTCAVVMLLGWALLYALPKEGQGQTAKKALLLYPLLAAWLMMVVHLGRLRARWVVTSKMLKPTGGHKGTPPPFEAQPARLLWGKFCFDPEIPSVFVSTGDGVAINAGSQRAKLYLAYFSGWTLIALWFTR